MLSVQSMKWLTLKCYLNSLKSVIDHYNFLAQASLSDAIAANTNANDR